MAFHIPVTKIQGREGPEQPLLCYVATMRKQDRIVRHLRWIFKHALHPTHWRRIPDHCASIRAVFAKSQTRSS